MAATLTFAIDNLGPYNVVAQSYCRRIVVQENYDSANPPTADLKMYIPFGSAAPVAVRVAKGTPAIFNAEGVYSPGQTVGQIQTSAGSITVQQIESSQV